MEIATVEDVIARIEAEAKQSPGGAIVFDGDGTLWTGDIGDDFFDALIDDARLTPLAHEALVREATAAQIDATGTPMEIARRIHRAYLAHEFPEERCCEIMAWAAAGWTKDELDAFAGRVMNALELEHRLHAEALRVARWARQSGIDVHLVSASPRAIVEQAARVVGIDHVSSACEVVDDSGRVRTEVHRPIPYGPGKVTRLREKLGGRPLYAAFGDNAFDVAMLQDARVPVAVRPKPRLVDRAHEVKGIVTLERL